MNGAFFLSYALRNILRGGQRSLLAVACIAFGVMSLVALQLLSGTIVGAIDIDPRAMLDGDAVLSRDGKPLSPADLETIERWQREGVITAASPTGKGPSPLVKREGSGRVSFVTRVLAVDPSVYPLVGHVEMSAPAESAFGDLLAAPDAAVVTHDLAERLSLRLGETLTIAGLPGSPPARLRVAGIAEFVPDRVGSTIFYSLATARRIAGDEGVVSAVSVLWGPAGKPASLESDGWSVRVPAAVTRDRARVVNLFSFMLEGTGLLGLLLGGIGVSNTMQVLLARRRGEIAVLKSIGYTRRHLLALFGIEAALLGLGGGAIGAALAVAVAHAFISLLARSATMLLVWSVDAKTLVSGVAVGVATAVIFGMHAIVRASAVRPATLLRDMPTPKAWRESLALYGALGALFAALSGAVLGSALEGVAIVAMGFAGLGVLALALGAAFAIAVRLPIPVPALAGLARSSLKRQTGRVVVALVALFCGVFTIGFAGSTMLGARERLDSRRGPETGEITVYGRATEAEAMRAELERQSATDVARKSERGDSVVMTGRVAPERLSAAVDAIGAALPETVVFSHRDMVDAMESAYENLFAFVAAVSGLALVAGAVLIANAVGLAMVERRREMGIMKAIGYSRAHVLATIASEYALLGLLAGLFGIGGVAGAMWLINRYQPEAQLSLDPAQAVGIVAVSIALALASAMAAAWGPTRRRPLEVLREE